jgi:hypothetical protein
MIPAKENGHPCLLKALGGVGLILLVTCVTLTLQSLESSDWLSFSNASGDYKLGLLVCRDCPDTTRDWSTDCFMQTGCDADSGSNWCAQWTKTDGAGKAVYYMDYLAVLCMLLLFERVMFMMIGRYAGLKLISYCLALGPAILLVVSIGQWFAITGAKFQDSCSNEGDDLKFCAEQGSLINICASAVGFVGCGVSALYFKLSPSQDSSYFKIEGRRTFMLTKVVPVLLIVMFLDIFSLSWHWTYFENTKKHHNFLTYTDSYKGFTNLGLNCIASPACEVPSDITLYVRECTAYKRLYEAGELQRKFKLAEFVFALMWFECIGFCSTSKEFGLPFLQFLWPVSMSLTQIASLVAWSIKSGSAFTNNCQVLQHDKDIDFCSDTSVILAILGIVINSIAIASFVIVYVNRFDFKVKIHDDYEKTHKQKGFAKVMKNVANDTLIHSISINSSNLENTTLGAESRSATPFPKGRDSDSYEKRPLSKRKAQACSLCLKE